MGGEGRGRGDVVGEMRWIWVDLRWSLAKGRERLRVWGSGLAWMGRLSIKVNLSTFMKFTLIIDCEASIRVRRVKNEKKQAEMEMYCYQLN